MAFALLNAVVALIALGAIQLHLADPQLLERLCLEDGIVEWATTAFFLLSGLLFATAAVRASDGRLFVLGLSLLCLFVTGEEISWGQRLFAIDPPDVVAANNVQGEMNLHNLAGIHGSIRLLGTLFVVAIFVVLPIAARLSTFCAQAMQRLGVVGAPLRHAHLAIVSILFQAVANLTGSTFYFYELGELVLSLAFLAFSATLVGRTLGHEASGETVLAANLTPASGSPAAHG